MSTRICPRTVAALAPGDVEDLLFDRLTALRELDAGYVKDVNGDLRLIFPMPTWEDYLSLAFDDIRLCGSESLQVLRRLRAALNDLLGSLTDVTRVDAVRLYLRHLDDGIAHSKLDQLDRSLALQGDQQGLGVSRDLQ
ncbi:MAG: DUF2254 family protein [Vulcanimicrobiaceae bacterium]